MPHIARYYVPKKVDAGQVVRALQSVIEKRISIPSKALHLYRWLSADGIDESVEVRYNDLYDLCDLGVNHFSGYFNDQNGDEIGFAVIGRERLLILFWTEGKDALAFHLELVQYLGLERSVHRDNSRDNELVTTSQQLRCFISFDFTSEHRFSP
jgi:hypothetical protein